MSLTATCGRFGRSSRTTGTSLGISRPSLAPAIASSPSQTPKTASPGWGRSTTSRGLGCERECLPHEALHRGPLGIRRRGQPDETKFLPAAFEQSAPVVYLAAAREEQGRVGRERADRGHVLVVERVADDLVHRPARARGPA